VVSEDPLKYKINRFPTDCPPIIFTQNLVGVPVYSLI
jgi:hypothetical protein